MTPPVKISKRRRAAQRSADVMITLAGSAVLIVLLCWLPFARTMGLDRVPFAATNPWQPLVQFGAWTVVAVNATVIVTAANRAASRIVRRPAQGVHDGGQQHNSRRVQRRDR